MISAKLFAHIHNDAHLVGTRNLEGMEFSETIKYLTQYVSHLKKDVQNDKQLNYLEPLLKKLEYLEEFSLKLKEVRQSVQDSSLEEASQNYELCSLSKEILSSIEKLTTTGIQASFRQGVLMPGGWQNGSNGGHALIYEFQYDDEGNLIFLVHNTGAGLNFHHKIQEIDKDRYCPVKAYKIPKGSIDSERLNWFIQQLIIPQLTLKGVDDSNAKELYTQVFSKIAYLDGVEVSPYEYTKQDSLTAGQRSGTCAEKSLHQMVESVMPNKKAYRQFIYEFKKYSLQQYIQQVNSEQTINEPGVRNQISLAVENMARAQLKEDYFDGHKRQQELMWLKEKLDEYKRVEPSTLSVHADVAEIMKRGEEDKYELEHLDIRYPSVVQSLIINQAGIEVEEKVARKKIQFDFEEENFSKALNAFVKEIENLSKDDPNATVESVEDFLTCFPLYPDEQFKRIYHIIHSVGDCDKRLQIFANLDRINELYIKSYRHLHQNQNLPSFSTSEISFITIVSSLSSNTIERNLKWDLYNRQDNKAEIGFLEIMQDACYERIASTVSSPFWASENPHYDRRLVECRSKLLIKKPEFAEASGKTKTFYDQIIRKHGIWETLDEYYEPYCKAKNISEREQVMKSGSHNHAPIYLIAQFLKMNQSDQSKFINELCKHKELKVEQQKELQNQLENICQEIKYFYRLDHMVEKALSAIMLVKPQENYTLLDFENKGYDSDGFKTPTLQKVKEKHPLSSSNMRYSDDNLIFEILSVNYGDKERAVNEAQFGDFLKKKFSQHLNLSDIKWIRELLQLRVSDLQLPATVNYFRQHIDTLQNLNICYYLEKNIFQPPYLIQVLEEEPQVVEELHHLLQTGISCFTFDGIRDETALFLAELDLKLTVYEYDYYSQALKIQKENSVHLKEKLTLLDLKLQSNLQSLEEEISKRETTDRAKYSLYQQKILITSHNLKKAGSLDDKRNLIKPCLSAILNGERYKRKTEVENLNKNQTRQATLRNIQILLLDIQKKDLKNDFVENVFIEILSEMAIEFKQIFDLNLGKLSLHFPVIKVLEQSGKEIGSINLETGRMSKPGLNHAWLPEQILNHPMYQTLFSNYDPAVLANPEESYFEFEYQDEKYRILLKTDNQIAFQKMINIMDQGLKWYQAEDVAKIDNLQGVLLQKDHIAWMTVQESEQATQDEDQVIIMDKHSGEMKYCYTKKSQELVTLDQTLNAKARVVTHTSEIHKYFSSFENPEYILVTESNSVYEVNFIRYGLQLNIKPVLGSEKEIKDWEVLLSDSSLRLWQNETQIINGLESMLCFKGDELIKAILPVQPFMVEQEFLSNLNESSVSLVYQGHGGGPTLVQPTGQGQENVNPDYQLNDPTHQFEEKKSRHPKATSNFKLNDPEHQFLEKKQSSTNANTSSTDYKLEDPTQQYTKKKSLPSVKIPQPLNDEGGDKKYPNSNIEKLKKDDSKSDNTGTEIPKIPSNVVPIRKEVNKEASHAKSKEQTEYYNLTQDTRNFVNMDKLGLLDPKNPSKHNLSYYANTELTKEYIVEGNELIPLDMEGGLNLAYIYLCKKQPQKAFDTLKYCEEHFGELIGTNLEIDLIKWMIFCVPAKLKNTKVGAEIETPEFLSVKLKALCMLESFKREHPEFCFSPTKQTEQSLNGQLDRILSRERQSFYANLESNIHALFYKYHHTRNNVPTTLKLSEYDQLTLLRSIFLNDAKAQKGPLAFSWRRLESKRLGQELSFLKQKSAQYNQSELPPSLVRQIEEVTNRILKDKKVLRDVSVIQEVSRTLDVRRYTKIHYQGLSYNSNTELNNQFTKHFKNPSGRQIDIFSCLKFPIDEGQFVLSFPSICDAIYNGQLSQRELQEITHFSEQTLKSYYDVNEENLKSNLPRLCVVLNLMARNIDKLKVFERSESKDEKRKKYETIKQPFNFEFWLSNLEDLIKDVPDKENTISVVSKIDLSPEAYLKEHKDNAAVMTSTSAIISELTDKRKVIKKPNISTYPIQEHLPTTVLSDDNMNLKTFFSEAGELEEKHIEKSKILKQEFAKADTITNYQQRRIIQDAIDIKAGQALDDYDEQLTTLAIRYLGKSKVRELCLDWSQQYSEKLETLCIQKLSLLEEFANKNFRTKANTQTLVDLQLALLGKQKKKLQLNDFLRLYLHQDIHQTQKETGLTEHECQLLHNMMNEYLVLSIQLQHYQRIIKSLDNSQLKNLDVDGNSNNSEKNAIAQIAKTVLETNVINHTDAPAFNVFQYDQKIMIRDIQKKYINQLLTLDDKTHNFKNEIIQLIMGGGKSSVILPILALQKATGENLSVIEVPESLYKTNLSEFNNISLRLFGQHAFGFEFDRQSPSDAKCLKKMYREFKRVSTSKGYVVTTKESMASLQLKYHELLNTPQDGKDAKDIQEWEKQIKWLDRIIRLIHDRGDALIDEVDTSLTINKQINYTIGEQTATPYQHYQTDIALFAFMDKLQFEDCNLLDVALNPDKLSPQRLNEMMNVIAHGLLERKDSPIVNILPPNLDPEAKEKTLAYLLGTSKDYPEWISKLSNPLTENTIKLIRGELKALLPHTLPLKVYQHYGPSQDKNKDLIDSLISIPYAGNNEPQEQSKDVNYIKTINLTIQSNLINGFNKNQLKHFFTTWEEQAKSEIIENPSLGSIDNSEIGQKINEILRNANIPITFSEINLSNSKHMKLLSENLKKNRTFILHTLENDVFPRMVIDNLVLSHNPLNHVSMYRTAQGVTGTPSNYKVMHQRFNFNRVESLGTDGLTIARLKKKETPIHVLNYENVYDYLNKAIKKMQTPDKLRAIIDIGATFRGVSNNTVAQEIARYIRNNPRDFDDNIQFVIFYAKDELTGKDELFALPVQQPLSKPISLKGRNTSEINQLLKCSPSQRFTYYDDLHKIGANIKQAPDAVALAPIDRKTQKKDLSQGIMRMRDFEAQQRVEIIISEETAESINTSDITLNINHIVDMVSLNQEEVLLQEHFSAALQKMENIIYQNIHAKILNIDSKNAKEKANLHNHFNEIFIKETTKEIINQYGQIETEQKTRDILELHLETLMQSWKVMLKAANNPMESKEEHKLRTEMRHILEDAILHCKEKYASTLNVHKTEQTTQTQQAQKTQQQSQQQQQQSQQQQEQQQQNYDRRYYDYSATCKFWTEKIEVDELLNFDQSKEIYKADSCYESPLYSYPLPTIQNTLGFDENITRSYNMLITENHDGIRGIKDQYQKQVHTIMMIQTPKGLSATLLTYPEAADIKRLLKKNSPEPPNYIWVMDTMESIFYGIKPPKHLMHSSYNNILQQIQFYNGNLHHINGHSLVGSWLMINHKEKLNYFREHLLPYRMCERRHLDALEKKIQLIENALYSIVTAEYSKLKDMNWKNKYPNLAKLDYDLFSSFVELLNNLSNSDNNQLVIPEPFTNLFFYNLISDNCNEDMVNRYIKSLPTAGLKQNLISQVRILNERPDYQKLLKIIAMPSFTSPGIARQSLTEVLFESFTNEVDFSKGGYFKRIVSALSKDEILQVIQFFSPTQRKELMQAFGETVLSTLFDQDIKTIQSFLQDIPTNHLTGILCGIKPVELEEKQGKYRRRYYDSPQFILLNQEKFKFIIEHFPKVEIQAYLSSYGLVYLLSRGLDQDNSNAPADFKMYHHLISTMFTNQVPDECASAIVSGLLNNIGGTLSIQSFKDELTYFTPTQILQGFTQAPNWTIDAILEDESHTIADLLLQGLKSIESIEKQYELINNVLVHRKGSSLFDDLKEANNNSDLYHYLTYVNLCHEISKMIEDSDKPEKIISQLGEYVDEMKKSPANFLPLSEVIVQDKEQQNHSLIDLIQEKCNVEVVKAFDKLAKQSDEIKLSESSNRRNLM